MYCFIQQARGGNLQLSPAIEMSCSFFMELWQFGLEYAVFSSAHFREVRGPKPVTHWDFLTHLGLSCWCLFSCRWVPRLWPWAQRSPWLPPLVVLWTSEGELRVFVWATQRHLPEEFTQDSGSLSSQVSSWESRTLLLAAPGAQMIREDPYHRFLHSLAASKQRDGCELRGGDKGK